MDTGFIIAVLLIALVCPITMWLMMRGHGGDHTRHQDEQRTSDEPHIGPRQR